MKITQPRTDHDYRQLVTNTSAGGTSITPPAPLVSTDVQAIINEIQAEIGGLPASLHFLTSRGGGRAEVQIIAASGAAQTLDLSLYNVFDITLTANCTYTFSNPPPSGVDADFWFVRRQGGSGSYTETWPAAVSWPDTSTGLGGGPAPTLHTAVGAQNVARIQTGNGGANYGGTDETPGAGGSALTIKDEGTPLATFATSLDFVGAGVVASGATAAKTITISGAPTGAAGGDLSGTYPNPTVNPSAISALLPPAHAHVDNVLFSGDGSTTAFILPAAPVDATSIGVYVAGSRSQDWTLSGGLLDTLTFGVAPASATDNIVVDIAAAL